MHPKQQLNPTKAPALARLCIRAIACGHQGSVGQQGVHVGGQAAAALLALRVAVAPPRPAPVGDVSVLLVGGKRGQMGFFALWPLAPLAPHPALHRWHTRGVGGPSAASAQSKLHQSHWALEISQLARIGAGGVHKTPYLPWPSVCAWSPPRPSLPCHPPQSPGGFQHSPVLCAL